MKISIQTLGCKVNQSESASIEGLLRKNGYEVVNHTDGPDVCIINTCTVTAKSDYQSRQLIRRAARSGARVIATGCYAQLRPDELSKINGHTLTIGNSEKRNIILHLKELSTKKNGASTITCRPDDPPVYDSYFSKRSRAFLKVQDGCNFACSYCTVPLARGKSRSMTPEDVMLSVKNITEAGYREIVLTGIHIGSYGTDFRPRISLHTIVENILNAFPEIRIRLSSIEPQEVSDELLLLMRHENVCSHLHIPLQSGSDKILKMMNRGYSTRKYAQLINSLFTTYPEIAIGADIIAGYPGESEKDFQDTVKFVNDLPLSYFHIFPYSKRPNTMAASASDHVDEKVKKDRVRILLDLGKWKKIEFMKRNLYKNKDVIVEKRTKSRDSHMVLSDNYLKIHVKSASLTERQRLKVRVISLTDGILSGEPID